MADFNEQRESYSPAENQPPAPGVQDPVTQQAMRNELASLEQEIATLKHVLHAKEEKVSELRNALGLTPLSQIKAEISKVQASQAYKKTSDTLKTAGQATASVFNTIGTSMSNKFSEMKNSPTFKSFEEKVEGVGSSIMAKVSGTPKDEEEESKEDGFVESQTGDGPVTHQPSHAEDIPM